MAAVKSPASLPEAVKRKLAADLLAAEMERLGRGDLPMVLTFSDAAWRAAMRTVGCPAYIARLASPTARRGTRGKLGMATICHVRHGHPGVVYIRTYRRDWHAIAETVCHEALHLARPSYSHRQVHMALHPGEPLPPPRRRGRARARRRR
jgi:hypothetical protein